MFQLKVFKFIFLAVLPLFVVVGFVLIKSNTAYGEEVCYLGFTESCDSYQRCSFCSGEWCTCLEGGMIVCYTCQSGQRDITFCYDSETGNYSSTHTSECYDSFSCESGTCPLSGCYADYECPTDDGCTDYSCVTTGTAPGFCSSIDLCPNGNGGTPTPTPSVGPNFNVDIVQASGIVTIEQGQVATYDINIAPANNYSGTVNLSVSGCPSTATCAFSAGSVAFTNDSPNPGTSVLTVSNTANITPGTYSLTVTGTDTVPDPDLTDSDNSDLTLNLSSLAICDSTWRDMPDSSWASSNISAAQDNGGVYRYSPLQWTAWPYYSGGLMQDKCTFGWGSVCLWQSNRISKSDFTGYQVYAQDANNIFVRGGTGYFSGYGLTVTSESTWKFTPPSSWTDVGAIPEPWGTPTSVTDKDGRVWNFQYLGWPFFKAQYQCTPAAPPTCSSAGPVGWTTTATTGTHDVFAYGVSSNVTAVKFPTWGDPGGQDDIVWYPGTNMGGGTWKASVNLADHKAGDPEYGNINVHIYMDTASMPNTYCGSATFTRDPVNQPPTVPSVTVTEPDYCSSFGAYVNWTYSDPEGDPQSAYQIQIDEQGSFGSPEVDTGKVSSGGTSYFASSGLAFNITYKARVRVWDSHDSVSSWKESGSWKTPKHAYPYTDFIYTPSTDIPAKQPVQFTDQTTFYDGGGGQRVWSWVFGDGGTSNVQNPSPHTYNLPGLYSSSLTATDKDNYSCSRTKPITVAQPVPVWKEVSPR